MIGQVGEEIKEMKKTLPTAGADGTRPASPMDSQIESKEKVNHFCGPGTTYFCLDDVHFRRGTGRI